jgi:hypothetical protein
LPGGGRTTFGNVIVQGLTLTLTLDDGAQTLAVLLETVDAHDFHAGPNRRFMAVTKRLPR